MNRFKAYTHILANQLNFQWQITTDLDQANLLVQPLDNDNPNEKGLVISRVNNNTNQSTNKSLVFSLSSDEKRLIRILNQASSYLSQTTPEQAVKEQPNNTIQVFGSVSESVKNLCINLNQYAHNAEFTYNPNLSEDGPHLFRGQMLLFVNPVADHSIQFFHEFNHTIHDELIIFEELTIAIIQTDDDNANGDVFDLIYELADDSTKVTLLDISDPDSLRNFAQYF